MQFPTTNCVRGVLGATGYDRPPDDFSYKGIFQRSEAARWLVRSAPLEVLLDAGNAASFADSLRIAAADVVENVTRRYDHYCR